MTSAFMQKPFDGCLIKSSRAHGGEGRGRTFNELAQIHRERERETDGDAAA